MAALPLTHGLKRLGMIVVEELFIWTSSEEWRDVGLLVGTMLVGNLIAGFGRILYD
jgi:hypothetical protein